MYESVQVSIPKYHNLSDLNKKTLISHSFRNEKSGIEVPAWPGSSEGPLSDL
jgi:hypothetical protein